VKKILVMSISLILIIFGIYANFAENWSEDAVSESKKRGDEIVFYIEEFKTKYGNYPQSLEDLPSEKLSKFKSPLAGNKTWIYENEPLAKSYSLRVGTGNLETGPILRRDHRYWIYDTQ
jgi:hypothetical protein